MTSVLMLVLGLPVASFRFFFFFNSCFLLHSQDEDKYEQTSDVRSQLRFFEQLEKMEKQRKDEQEREILLKAAKVRVNSTEANVELMCFSFFCFRLLLHSPAKGV